MKIIDVIDDDGFKQRYQVQDDIDNPTDAVEFGLNVSAPDTREIDWDQVALELHNKLHDLRLFTMADVARSENGLNAAINSVLLIKLKQLYK